MAEIIDLNTANQQDPLFGKKEMVKLLGLNLTEAFADEVTFAVDTARQCLDMLTNGELAPAPEPTDGLLEFLGVFSRFVESPEFKFIVKPETKQNILDYIMAVEMLCFERAAKNQKFAMELQRFEKFPMVFTPPAVMQPQQATPQPTAGDTSQFDMSNTMKQVDQAMKQGAM
jgi:hypothetical protein